MIRNEVKRLSKNLQVPFIYQSLSEDVFLSTTESRSQPAIKPDVAILRPVVNPEGEILQPLKPDAKSLAQQSLAALITDTDDTPLDLATRALKIDKNLPLALAISGHTRPYNKRKEARAELERAVRYEPNNPLVLSLYAKFIDRYSREKPYGADSLTVLKIANQALSIPPQTAVDYFVLRYFAKAYCRKY